MRLTITAVTTLYASPYFPTRLPLALRALTKALLALVIVTIPLNTCPSPYRY
jgi:hypothetical protein